MGWSAPGERGSPQVSLGASPAPQGPRSQPLRTFGRQAQPFGPRRRSAPAGKEYAGLDKSELRGVSGMATTFGIIHRLKGATVEQYSRTLKVVHPDSGKGLPPGQTYHAAGPTDDGIVVVAIWDSESSWVKFRDETLLPGWPLSRTGCPGRRKILFRCTTQSQPDGLRGDGRTSCHGHGR